MRDAAALIIVLALTAFVFVAFMATAQVIGPLPVPINLTTTPTNHTIVSTGVLVSITPVPINSSAVNVTITAYNMYTMQPASVTVYLNVVSYYVNASAVYVYASYALNVTGSGYEIVNWYPNATGIAWNVYINGAYYPSYRTYFFMPVTVPIITPPSPIATLVGFIGLAVFVALAGRHRLRDAGLGALVFGLVMAPALTMLGLASPSLYVLTGIMIMLGIITLMIARKIEEP